MADDDKILPMRLPYGQRYNPKSDKLDAASSKGIGFRGPVSQDDHIVSEYSSDRDIQYPSIYEGIDPKDLAAVMMAERLGRSPPRDVDDRAYAAAKRRQLKGFSPFFEHGKDKYPDWSPDQYWPEPAIMRDKGGKIERKTYEPIHGLKITPPAEELSSEPDIRDYQLKRHAHEFEGAEEPTVPRRSVVLDAPLFGGKYELGTLPYKYAPAVERALNLAYGQKTLPLYFNRMTAPLGVALDAYEASKFVGRDPKDVKNYTGVPGLLMAAGKRTLPFIGLGASVGAGDLVAKDTEEGDTVDNRKQHSRGGAEKESAPLPSRDMGRRSWETEKDRLRRMMENVEKDENAFDREPYKEGGYVDNKAVKNALRLANEGKFRLHQTLARTGYASGGVANAAARKLIEEIDALIPYRGDGGVIDPNRQTRDYGADVKQWREERGKRGHKKGYNPWADDSNIYTNPTEERHDPNDPMYHVSPEEYKRGAYGRGVYALADGGRAGYALGGEPTNIDPTNPVVDANQPQTDPTRNYVQSLYQNVMGRPGDQGGVDYWTNQLNQGDINQAQALQQFAGSQEFGNLYQQDPSKAVNALYQTALGRAPDQAGTDYWTNQAKQGMKLGDMVSGFTGSQEGQNVQNINQAYQDYTGNVPTNAQLQQAQQIFAGGGDYNDFIEKAFGDGITDPGTQVAGPTMLPGNVSTGSIPQTLYDTTKSMWDTGSTQLKEWFPGLIGQEGGPAGWNAQAKSSSAKGPFQFITGTWNDNFAKMFGEQLGIKASDLGHYTKKGGYVPTKLGKEIAALRTDTSPEGKALTMAMGLGFNQNNADALTNAGLPLTRGNVYSVHFSGNTKLAQMAASNPNAPISSALTKQQLAKNPFYKGKTVGQVMNEFEKMLTSADKIAMGNRVISGYQQARGITPEGQTPATSDPALVKQQQAAALAADQAAWQKKKDAYVSYLVNNKLPIVLPPELDKYAPGAGGTMTAAPTGTSTGTGNIGQGLTSTGAGGNVGNTGMVNPNGTPIGGTPSTGGAYVEPNAAWGTQAFGDKTLQDALNQQYQNMANQGFYQGPPGYNPNASGVQGAGTFIGTTFEPSIATGYQPTNIQPGLAFGNPYGWKNGGAVKPDKEDVENALRLAKGGRRVNTRIDKDPAFDMSLKDGGGAWTRKEGKNPEGGLNAKGRASAKAEGHDLKPPAPHPKTDAAAARRKSFCARMKGMKAKLTSSETANDPDSRINKSLRVWNCHSDGGVVDNALRVAEGGEVWDKSRPKSLGESDPLSKSQKKSAKAAAKAAGRPYPNLVDNMRAAQRKK